MESNEKKKRKALCGPTWYPLSLQESEEKKKDPQSDTNQNTL